ncbi:MAG: response regulator, partial [Methanoregula sp.]|nr:response regulator [Methanoregula sp.]
MNSDPSGTDADSPSVSDGEPVIDIFILSKDARDSRQLVGQLTDQGYRVTPFSESFELLDRLRMGKPNLLICNAAGPEEEGYQACREIKADEDLWNIPVLLITGVSSLGDLLIVLDSNADNFIARPWDAQYLGSLIELMLASPVEKPDPEKIRTQFKIRHEDREYVITADRRKLLEFLLSSFEIAMNRASDLSRVVDERNTLTSTLESRVSDRTRELSTEVARLQTETSGKSHELDAAAKALAAAKNDAEALRTRISENEMALAAKADELARANEDLESTRAHLAEEEDAVRTLGAEKEELEHALRGDVESVNADLEKTRAALAEAQKELAALSAERTDLGQQLDTLGGEYEGARKSLAASAIEIGQLKSDLATEKNRADTAEQEVKSILQEKAKSEEELRQMIGDITAKATQQSQEVMRLSDQLGAEQKQRESVEQDFLSFRQESEKKEAGYIAERDSFFGHHDELQQKYDALTASLGAEREKAATREGDVERLAAEKRQLENDLLSARGQIEAISVVLDEEKRLRAAAELNAKNGIESKNDELRELAATIDALRSDLDARGSELSLAGKERDEAQAAYKDASDRLA